MLYHFPEIPPQAAAVAYGKTLAFLWKSFRLAPEGERYAYLSSFVSMQTGKFLLDERFRIDAGKNVVTDLVNGTETKLEPRLMRLLCLLASSPGELVSREYIIREIWNDYGGADDALHQAVSFLRKALDDSNKTCIRTIPKKGYTLDAVISPSSTIPAATPVNKERNRIVLLLAITTVIIIAAFIGRNVFFPSQKPGLEPPGAIPDTTYQYQELRAHLESLNKADTGRN